MLTIVCQSANFSRGPVKFATTLGSSASARVALQHVGIPPIVGQSRRRPDIQWSPDARRRACVDDDRAVEHHHLVIAYGEEDIMVGNRSTGNGGVKQVRGWSTSTRTAPTIRPTIRSRSPVAIRPYSRPTAQRPKPMSRRCCRRRALQGRLPQEPQLRALGRSAR